MSEAKRRMSTLGALRALFSRGACSGAFCEFLDRALDDPLGDEEYAAMPLAGGILQHGYQCGMLWGATLAAGARAYRLLGAGPRAEARAVAAARRLVETFRAQNGSADCVDITDIDSASSALQTTVHFFVKGGSLQCARMAARYAPAALDVIGATLPEEDVEAAAPASCAALLARRMGASDLHAVMAAGFAGGIGLSGGACGALGAAIWLMGIGRLEAGAGKLAYKAPDALELIARFLKRTGHTFECAGIVGRRFEGVSDHAAHLRGGGCGEIIEVLAAAAAPRPA